MMAATLAFGGKNPVTGKQVMDADKVPGVLAVMATAGLYDDSGKWLYHTGLPAKSGVGGGIIAVSPGKFGIAVVSPPLDDAGNSVRAQQAIADISNALGGCSSSSPSESVGTRNFFHGLRSSALPPANRLDRVPLRRGARPDMDIGLGARPRWRYGGWTAWRAR